MDAIDIIINDYCKDGAKKLYKMVDKILFKLHFVDIDKNEFYSLAGMIFTEILKDYDQSKSFDGFLYSCLYKKFCTEMTKQTRDKRCKKIKVKETDENGNCYIKTKIIPTESLNAPIGDKDNLYLIDICTDGMTIEREIFEEKEEGYSNKMMMYLNRLSNLQKEVLRLKIAGYTPNEIKDELHISEKEYCDCNTAIHSYRNVSLLF